MSFTLTQLYVTAVLLNLFLLFRFHFRRHLYYRICTVTAVAVHFFIVFHFQFPRHLHGTVVVIYTGTTVVYHMEVCVLRPLAIEIYNELTRLSRTATAASVEHAMYLFALKIKPILQMLQRKKQRTRRLHSYISSPPYKNDGVGVAANYTHCQHNIYHGIHSQISH